ncbi:serine/threonine-protein kinase [Nocardioides sp. GXZ039]|uniref:serine/threonine-protein kinase n=1 Tax=Nocardioides sp. GXZ039 TaxID=3136018 RepID=UPI0030F42749
MIDDRYTLEREIGRGGMGAVWLARDELLGRTVAVKRVGVMPGGSSPDLVRAEREARIAASLNHPHIVGVYDLVQDGDQQYLVMEYVEGSTLAELIRSQGRLAPRDAARILAQAATALAAAHGSLIVHRDVKPSNILVGNDGQVKLTDFGIARMQADAALTQTGLVTGSPAYLAPEVASGRPATPASDVWSLGASLYHALAGAPPYDVGDNVLGTLYQIVNEPPPRLADPGELEPVLLATMAHDPEHRWAMDDVARVLEMVAQSEPVQATALPAATTVLSPGDAGPPDEPTDEGLLPFADPEPEPEPSESPAPPASAVASDEPTTRYRPTRRRAVLPILIGLLVLALLGVILALALSDDPQDASPPPGVETTSETPTPPPSSEPSTPTSSAPAEPTEKQIKDFVRNYIPTAVSNPEAGFQLLTPAYQAASNGIDGYAGFWGNVVNAKILSLDADADALTATYTYRRNMRGSGPVTETVTLQLVQTDAGDLLIDDAS